MKITGVETYWTQTPFDIGGKPQVMGGLNWQSMNTVWLRIRTDAGVDGWGEAFGHGTSAGTLAVLDTQLAPMLVGQDARDIAGLRLRLGKHFHLYGQNGPHVYALSALDIALWDIAGKVANQPLWRLLGGAPVGSMRAYASLLRYGEAGQVAAACERAAGRGYRDVKLHEITTPEITAARDALGEQVRLMVDVNCPWTVWQALAMERDLEDLDLTWLEEPVWPPGDHDGLARVRLEGGIPVAAGECGGPVRLQGGVRGGRARHRATQCHEDRRAVGDGGNRGAGAGVFGPAGAAQCVFRGRVFGVVALQRGAGAGSSV